MHLDENKWLPNLSIFKLNGMEVGWLLLLLVFSFIVSGALQFVMVSATSYSFNMKYLQPFFYALPFPLALYSYYILMMKGKGQSYHFNFSPSPWYLYPVMFFMFLGAMLLNEVMVNYIPTSGLGGLLDNLYKELEKIQELLDQYPEAMIISTVVLAPFLEELFFRGVILKGLLNNKKINPWVAILISAALFGIVHFNPWQLVGAFFLGFLLGWVYYKTGTLFNTIFLHFVNNGFTALMYYHYGVMNIYEVFHLSQWGALFFGIIFLLIFGFAFYKLTRNSPWKFY